MLSITITLLIHHVLAVFQPIPQMEHPLSKMSIGPS